jgi:alanine-glyoxylate transaminase / serine-glyoxylate transaminase / serine-pyruvate transaminase
MHRASEDHRSVEFPDFVRPLLSDTRALLGAQNGHVLLFPASGSGGWEAALVNTLEPGARVLLPCAGQFANLWADTARRLGFVVDTFADLPWGAVPDPEAVTGHLQRHGEEIRAVLVVHNETSTGVTADIAAIRAAIDSSGHTPLLMVDGVSSIASLPYAHDQWRVDIGITGSQKGLMLPAGLAVVALSNRASEAAARGSRRAYFDFGSMLAQNALGYFPYTPSIPMLYGLREAVDMLNEEGLPQVFARHAHLAAGVRAAVQAWGLSLCCRDVLHVSNTVSTIMMPEGTDGAELIAHAYRRYNIALGAGLGPLAGKAFRIGHLGDLNEGMLLGALGLVEMALHDVGVRVATRGVVAAQTYWHEHSQ